MFYFIDLILNIADTLPHLALILILRLIFTKTTYSVYYLFHIVKCILTYINPTMQQSFPVPVLFLFLDYIFSILPLFIQKYTCNKEQINYRYDSLYNVRDTNRNRRHCSICSIIYIISNRWRGG